MHVCMFDVARLALAMTLGVGIGGIGPWLYLHGRVVFWPWPWVMAMATSQKGRAPQNIFPCPKGCHTCIHKYIHAYNTNIKLSVAVMYVWYGMQTVEMSSRLFG